MPSALPSSAWWPNKWQKVNPDLVTRDPDGKAFTVRYEAVNAMLLNEFLNEHRKVAELRSGELAEPKSVVAKQQVINAQQQREVNALAATLREQASQIQKVSAQLELQKASAQTVVNNRVDDFQASVSDAGPTPTPSPTATAAATPTSTATPSATARPNPTARPRPTLAPRP